MLHNFNIVVKNKNIYINLNACKPVRLYTFNKKAPYVNPDFKAHNDFRNR